MILLQVLIFVIALYALHACFMRFEHEDSPRNLTQKPPSGIASCLIPPFEGFVYHIEGPVVGRLGMRTGCYVKANSKGSPFPNSLIFPLRSAKPLEYYVTDSNGKKWTMTETSTLELQITTSEKTEVRQFSFEQMCFPMPCYASAAKQERACYKSFPHTCEAAVNMCDDEDLEKIQWELTQVKNLGRSSRHYEQWLYCKSEDDQPAVPVMTPEFPFGRLEKLTRLPTFKVFYPGPEIRMTIEYLGPNGTLVCGCDVVFPLEPSYNTYMHRFFFWNRISLKTSIRPGETVLGDRFKAQCLEGQQLGNDKKCINGRIYENFTFEDFCFPKECFIGEQPPPCTGKAGTYDREWKGLEIYYFPSDELGLEGMKGMVHIAEFRIEGKTKKNYWVI